MDFQFLQAMEEISNASIPEEVSNINTLLSKIVEETVTAVKEPVNVANND